MDTEYAENNRNRCSCLRSANNERSMINRAEGFVTFGAIFIYDDVDLC